jgi:5,10-methylenetetrahydromethanopterin reductase
VTAAAVAALQIESGGRAVCGYGRGDSSAAHIGGTPATQRQLRDGLARVRGYLHGEEVDREGTPSRLRWLPAGFTPPPLDLAATGPRTIELAAELADRVSFAVGAAPERLRWALDVLEAHLARIGRARADIQVGAYLNVVADPDPGRARDLARTATGLVAHFTAMRGAPTDHLPPRLRSLAERLRDGYDMGRHAREGAAHLDWVDDEFVDWFAIIGPPAEVADRLGELVDSLGLEHVHLLGGSPVDAPIGARMSGLLDVLAVVADSVLPTLRHART